MKVLEIFAGYRCISKAFERKGHECFTVEWSKDFENISLYEDVNNLTKESIIELCNGKPDIIWASPDCTTYSIAGISHHRKIIDNERVPISEYAKFCDKTNEHVIKLIKELNPKYYFIENPVGCFRKMNFVNDLPRYTITYCQYGDTRMKPTDIFTNHPNPNFKKPCKNGMKCHQSAPRGSRTGTQGLRNHKERSRIPIELCNHIVDISEM